MLQQIRAANKDDEGFTLIELLIVIVILGVLAGIVVFGVAQFRNDSTTAACNADVKTVNVAADAFDAQTGNYPTSINDLTGGKYLSELPSGTWSFDGGAKTASRNPGC